MKRVRLLTTIVTVLSLAGTAIAAGPSALNYQGVLRDASGNPLTGSYVLRFRLFDVETGGTELMNDLHSGLTDQVVEVADGLFNVEVGTGHIAPSGTTLADVIRDNDELWMQVEIGGGPGTQVLLPRIRIVSAAYAMNAASLDGKNAGNFLDTSGAAQTKAGDLTVENLHLTGNGLSFGDNGFLWTTPGITALNAGNDSNTDRLLLSITEDPDPGFIEIQGSGPIQIKSGDDNYVFGDTGSPRAQIHASGDLDLTGNLRINTAGPDQDHGIYFFNNGNPNGEQLFWHDVEDHFHFTDAVSITGGPLHSGGTASQVPFNTFGSGIFTPDHAEIESVSDLMVKGSIEIDDTLFADGGIDVSGSSATDDDSIHFDDGTEELLWSDSLSRFILTDDLNLKNGTLFADNGVDISGTSATDNDHLWVDAGTESMYWHESTDHFHFTNDVYIAFGHALHVGSTNGTESYNNFGSSNPTNPAISSGDDVVVSGDFEVGGTLFAEGALRGPLNANFVIKSESSQHIDADAEVRTIIDADNSATARDAEWFRQHALSNTNKLMILQEDGDLFLRGTVFTNQNFDLAETFLASEPVEAGDLVRLDPDRPGVVRRTIAVADPLVLGVVSEAAGMVLGGASFDPGALRETWGDEVADEFASRRPQLRDAVLAENVEMRAELETAESFLEQADSSEPVDAEEAVTVEQPVQAHDPGEPHEGPSVPASDPMEDVERARSIRQELEREIEWLCLQRFHEERFAAVALAGRVPVKVEGPVLAGDRLMPGPTPGVAVKSDGSGPEIGTALEAWDAGEGKVLTFVQRGGAVAPAALEAARAEFEAAIEDRTPDPQTGQQTLFNDLQIVLDVGADEEARFSIFRDGETDGALGAEVFRVDEQGNVFAKGAFRPASMDVAEFFELSEPAEAGDLLTVDRQAHGKYRPATEASDPAVIGVVAGSPGVLLGGEFSRIAAADAELAAALDEARSFADRELEQELWRELETRFLETHAAVALTGTVLVKVDAGYGSIEPGDLLSASPTAGHAMRAGDTAAGTIVGKALEGLDTGTAKVRMLVMLR